MTGNISEHRIVVIGLDGATWDIIKPMIEKGKLPNIANIMKNGVHGDLESTIHPITPQAWSGFMTGKNAGKHSIYDFTAWKPNTYNLEFVNAGARKAKSIFKILSESGRKTGAIAIPFTFPPEDINGFMLSGIDAPAEDERSVSPPELHRELRQKLGNYYIHLASPVGRKLDADKFYSDVAVEDENRTQISLYLMKKYSPLDLFMTVYNNIDRAQHQFFTQDTFSYQGKSVSGLSLIEETYRQADEHIGRIRAELESNTTLMIMSDHGAGPINKVFFLNNWLEQQGFLNYGAKNNSIGLEVIQMVRAAAKRWLPRWAKDIIKSKASGARDQIESYLCFSEIDWNSTKAYGFGMYGNIYLNLKGREPQGVVEPGVEADELISEIITRLECLQDPDTGEKIVERVYRGKELYHGDYVKNAPDMIIKWKDYSYYTSVNSQVNKKELFGSCQNIDSSEYRHVGTHRLNGVFMATGNMIKKDVMTENAKIIDVAPTILYLLGQAIPDDMDGKILKDILSPDFLAKHPPKYEKCIDDDETTGVSPYSEEEEEKIKERLLALGYLE